jgi:hypothetical protein
MTDKQWETIKEGILLATDGVISGPAMIAGIEEITGRKIAKDDQSMFIDPRSQTPIIKV